MSLAKFRTANRQMNPDNLQLEADVIVTVNLEEAYELKVLKGKESAIKKIAAEFEEFLRSTVKG